jgi:(1->4)-alpha-D-glucan 1-alpha-D-glucosylmutase
MDTSRERGARPGHRPPRSTYRVQLHAGFPFEAAAEVIDYLAALGVSHLYSSPILQAARGSTHGYDVVDPTRVSEELGGPEGYARLVASLERHGLGLVLDIVPNHMAVTASNPWWWDVLENGASSRFAAFFDVDWEPPEARLQNVILVPVLDDHYGRVLEAARISLAREGARFVVLHGEQRFPVSPNSLELLLRLAAERVNSDALSFLADAHADLPAPTATDWTTVRRRDRDMAVLASLRGRLLAEDASVSEAVDAAVEKVNADPDLLDAVLEQQNYRLAWWRAAGRDLGYRRFFDIDTLAGLRAEDPLVFDTTHALVLRWYAEGRLDGIRIDHVDGLRDPEGYLERLRAAAPGAWIVVEKILEAGEPLRESWPVAGTTGYDFLNLVGGLFIAPSGEEPLTRLYAEITGVDATYDELVRAAKHQVLHEVLGSDVNRLTALFLEICERHRRHRDHTRFALHEVLREVLAGLHVYRTYVRPGEEQVTDHDVLRVDEAVATARQVRPDIDADLFDFLRDILLMRVPGRTETELAMRFQQLSGPVMAKGAEDTAFYRYHRLVALNEVGGDPSRFGVTPVEFHRACAETAELRPLTMLATSTHDTKRGEDVRTRLALISEMPDAWAAAVQGWMERNERHRHDGRPDRNTEYLFYQTLVGAWPIEPERAWAYMEKAAREAKSETSWTSPDEAYEAALRRFVEGTLRDGGFVAALAAFVSRLLEPGRVTSLAQTLIKLTAPGVPDVYQGTELWAHTLVDPDNRRPADFALRRRLLAELDGLDAEAILGRSDDGLPKLWVTRQALSLRARRPEAFGATGSYRPLSADGTRADHLVAFMRGGAALTLVPRLVLGLTGDWRDTTLAVPGGEWLDVMSGDRWRGGGDVPLARLLGRFPVALLERVDGR